MKRFALLVAVVAAMSGCTTASVEPLPSPPKVSVLPTPTTLPDYSGVSLPIASGTTTTVGPSGLKGGNGSIRGKVTIGGGGVAGASVRIDRFDGDVASGGVDLTSGPDGSYGIDGLNGGRYRVRAFRAPDAAMPQAQVLFLGADERRSLDLALQGYNGGTTISASVSPTPPLLGESGTLVVSVNTRGVDSGGTARSIPIPNVPVYLTSAGGKAITSASPTLTGANGRAVFTFICAAVDRQGLSVTIPGGAPVNVSVAECELPPTTTLPVDPLVPATTTPAATTPPRR